MYIDKIFPFLRNSDLIRCIEETVSLEDIYIPIKWKEDESAKVGTVSDSRTLKAYRVMPCDIIVLNEDDSVSKKVKMGLYGDTLKLVVFEVDYMSVVDRISVDTVDNVLSATMMVNDAYEKEEIVSDTLINYASNGIKVDRGLLEGIEVEIKEAGNLRDWIDNFQSEPVQESEDFFNRLMNRKDKGESVSGRVVGTGKDAVYNWLDSYFALPENVDMKNGGREVVPLLIGPTAVFKSATVKELCKKYNFRLVDFRVSFTSRLDYSGLFQIGDMGDEKFSYSCPMEEIVTCSDGFREYCRKAYDKVSEILTRGYLENNKASDGVTTDSNQTPITDEQREKLTSLLGQYKEYMKTPVLFFDEITRTSDAGVEGVLVQLLNQKKFNNLTLNGCKFVAATNLNLSNDNKHVLYKSQLDDLYDVKQDIDVAYSNRFMPLQVNPEDVQDRWFEWAESTKTRNGEDVSSIHTMILNYLKSSRGKNRVYNDEPVMNAIDAGLSENEIRSQTFPNYRTWDMLSDYLYNIDDDYKLRLKEDSNAAREYRDTIIKGLISDWAAEDFINYLNENGYRPHEDVPDDVGDFLESTLSAGVPALLIGPSSLGKTSRVNAYRKKVEQRTGLKPVLINVNLASKDTTDLMGYPVKQSLVNYVCGNDLDSLGLGSVSKDLQGIVEGVHAEAEYGMTDYLTRRAPDLDIKEKFQKALNEGREVILFFDECNRVQDKTVMSAMFECLSDARFAGVSFKDQKDKVKIVAACNMAYEGMEYANGDDWDSLDEAQDYSNAGSLDPALAARFSMYWKKKYDANDVQSWINFMESEKKEGNIDSTLLEFFKSLPTDEAIKTMARVEKRALERAEPSTRALFQLSKDILSMRGASTADGYRSSLYNGKVIFDDMITSMYDKVAMDSESINVSTESYIQEVIDLLGEITQYKDVWEPLLTGSKIDLGGGFIGDGAEIMDSLERIQKELKDRILKPMTDEMKAECRKYADAAIELCGNVREMDESVSRNREKIFTMYTGEDFASKFVKFFDSVYGTVNDEDITIEMLSDRKLIPPFFKKEKALLSRLGSNTDKMVDEMINLMQEFLQVHHTTLPSENYADFIDGIRSVFPSSSASDNMSTLLRRSDRKVEDMFAKAEGVGDAWIQSVIGCYRAQIGESDIQAMRDRMKGKSTTDTGKKRRTRIL